MRTLRHWASFSLLLIIFPGAVDAQRLPPLPMRVVEVVSGDTVDLGRQITQANQLPGITEIVVVADAAGQRPPFVFSASVSGTPNALPVVVGEVRITPGRLAGNAVVAFSAEAADGGFRLAEVAENGLLVFERAVFTGFRANVPGGLFKAGRLGRLRLTECAAAEISSITDGGVIHADGNAEVIISRCRFALNSAGGLGGVIAARDSAFVSVRDSHFAANAAMDGCALHSQSVGINRRMDTLIHGVTFAGGCRSALIVNSTGQLVVAGNTFVDVATALSGSGTFRLFGNLFGPDLTGGKALAKSACEGDGEYLSDGFNISVDDSCALGDETDQPNTDPGLEEPDENGVVKLKDGSTAIDAGATEVNQAIAENLGVALPCGYKDARDLGRPQDADGDGQFECDVGDYEVQGGPDIGAGQSGAFFDLERSGEGVFLEMLGDGQAVMAMFSYDTDKSGLAWFIGSGQVVGNTVVVDELLGTSGGMFGGAFDPAAVEKFVVAGTSLIFPSCEADAQPGKMAFQADEDLSYDDLLVNMTRLTRIVGCDGSTHALAGRSGSFFDPQRDGEGIFVQWLPNGNVVVIWYTYDDAGRQFWTISDAVTVEDGKVTATMVYPAQVTSFGDAFNASEIDLQPWGTVILDYQDCNALTFSYDSDLSDFGSGSFNYIRLTSLNGTDCSL